MLLKAPKTSIWKKKKKKKQQQWTLSRNPDPVTQVNPQPLFHTGTIFSPPNYAMRLLIETCASHENTVFNMHATLDFICTPATNHKHALNHSNLKEYIGKLFHLSMFSKTKTIIYIKYEVY